MVADRERLEDLLRPQGGGPAHGQLVDGAERRAVVVDGDRVPDHAKVRAEVVVLGEADGLRQGRGQGARRHEQQQQQLHGDNGSSGPDRVSYIPPRLFGRHTNTIVVRLRTRPNEFRTIPPKEQTGP